MIFVLLILLFSGPAVADTLTWQPSQNADGYTLHYGHESRAYTDHVDVGNVTNHTMDLAPGTHVAASAYSHDPRYTKSGYSNEVVIPEIVRHTMEIPKADWIVVFVDSEETAGEDGRAVNAIDGNTNTIWHTEWKERKPKHPHEIQIDLGSWYVINAFSYLPRQDGSENGTIAGYQFFVSGSKVNFGLPVAIGEFAANTDLKVVTLNTPVVGRYIRLVATSEINGRDYTSAAEIGVTGRLLFQCK